MLAVEMLFYQQRIHGQFRIDGVCNACHLGHLFHYHCVVYSIVRIFSPREGAVILYQYSRCVYRVQPFKALYNYISGFHFIRSFHFFLCHICRARYGIVEVICVCRSDIRNVTSGLRPGSSVSRVGVYHTTDFRESLVEYHVGWSV